MSEIELLRRSYPAPPAPKVEARSRARARMLERIENPVPAWRRSYLRPAPLLAATLVGLVVCGMVVLGLVTSDHTSKGAGELALLEAAETARQQPALRVPDSGFLYFKTVEGRVEKGKRDIPLFRSKVVEQWFGRESSGKRVTRRKPKFLNAEDRRRWLALGMALPAPPTSNPRLLPTTAPTPPDLPSNPGELLERMQSDDAGSPAEHNQAMFAVIGESLSDPLVPPAQRAALYEAAAQVPGVELVGRSVRDSAGRAGMAVGVSSEMNGVRETLLFDPDTAALLSKERVALPGNNLGYPPRQVISSATYSTAIVDTFGGRRPRNEAFRDSESAGHRYVPEPGTPEAEVYTRVDDLYEVFETTDRERGERKPVRGVDLAIDVMVKHVCDLMSRAALKELQATSPALDEDPKFACRQSTSLHFGRVARSGGLAQSANPTITDVQVDGDRAIVTLKFPGHAPRRLRMVNEEDRWKFDADMFGP